MNFEAKPIIKKTIEESEIRNEISNVVPTFPNIQRRPSRYKLLTINAQDKKDTKIRDINSLCELIKQIEQKKYNPFKKEKIIKTESNENNKDLQTQETDLPSGQKASFHRKSLTESELPKLKIIQTHSLLKSLGSNNDIEKDQYYSKLETKNNFGAVRKTHNRYVSDIDNANNKYTEKVKALLYDNKYASKRTTEKLNFHSMKHTIFKLFDKNIIKTRNKPSNKYSFKKVHTYVPKSIQKKENKKEYIKGKYYLIKKPKIPSMEKFDDFKITIISNYLSQIDFSCENKHKRKIFVIVDGTVIINVHFIPGVLLEMPKQSFFLSLEKEEKTKYFTSFLRLCQSRTKSSNPFKNIFNQNLKIIFDLGEIRDEDQFIFVSAFNSFKGISLSLSQNIIQWYMKDYDHRKILEMEKMVDGNKSSDEDNDNNEEEEKDDYVLSLFFGKKLTEKEKIQKFLKFSKPKRCSKIKNNSSFTQGEQNLENLEYFYYSDNEARKKEESNIISKKYPKMNDFFVHIQNQIHDKKLEKIKRNFSENLKKNKEPSTIKLTQKHLKRNHILKNLVKKKPNGLVVKDFSIIKSKNHERERRTKYIKSNIESIKNYFLENSKKVEKNISHLFCYNIPKIVANEKTNNKYDLFDLFSEFRAIITVWFDLHKNEQNPSFGVDFQTFKLLLPEFQNENEELTLQIFKRINKTNTGILTLDEFIEGMSLMHKQEFKDQVDFFIQVFDEDKQGFFTFDQVKQICIISLKRLMKATHDGKTDVLDEIGDYFAKIIFKVAKSEISKGLSVNNIKKAINDNTIENLDYLKTFCCCKKL